MQRQGAYAVRAAWYMSVLISVHIAGCMQTPGDDPSVESADHDGGTPVIDGGAEREDAWRAPSADQKPGAEQRGGGAEPSACDGPAPQSADRLLPGEILRSGQTLASANGQFHLAMQDDGNLVHYFDIGGAHRSHWSTETHGQGPGCAMLDAAGHIYVMTREGRVTWSSSGEDGRPGQQLIVQDDGNLVLYRDAGPSPWAGPESLSWATNRPLDWLAPGQRLLPGWFMTSQNWSCKLIMQHDGNLVLYGADDAVRWASDTDRRPGSSLIFQDDGNVVIYDPQGEPIWATDTDGHASDFLRLGGDCTAVLTEGEPIIWRAPEPVGMCCLLKPEGGRDGDPVGPRGGVHHFGADYPMPMNTPIRAGFSGTVELIYSGFPNCWNNGCTPQCLNRVNLVKIRGDCDDPQQPGHQLVAWYVHINQVAEDIVEGMHVDQGDVIAFSGNSGCSSGPHLHLEVASVPRGARVGLQSPSHIDPVTRYCQ